MKRAVSILALTMNLSFEMNLNSMKLKDQSNLMHPNLFLAHLYSTQIKFSLVRTWKPTSNTIQIIVANLSLRNKTSYLIVVVNSMNKSDRYHLAFHTKYLHVLATYHLKIIGQINT